MKELRRKILVSAIYITMLALIAVIILSFEIKPANDRTKIGFITPGDITATGWSAINYKGVESACGELGVELIAISDIDEEDGDCLDAVKKLVKRGCKMIILNSTDFADEMREHLAEYPEVSFYGANASYSTPNLTPYSTRLYQARYLSGIIAGMYTKTNKIGFVAGSKDNMVYRGINAFALGARKVNPDAEIVVYWTNDLNNEEKETKATEALIKNENIDIITYHQHRTNVIKCAEKYGIASIGYYEPAEGVSEKYLTCAYCSWEPVYKGMITEYTRGYGNSTNSDWLGLDSGFVGLSQYSPLVTRGMRMRVDEARERIISGIDVFTGEIYDNKGKKRCSEGEAISDETLLKKMDWLVEGARAYED